MPRRARIDAPGALHHVIVRGIARRRVFADHADRDFFIERLGLVLSETKTQCLARAIIPNHFHLLLKTGAAPIALVMKRFLTGYAMHYSRRHKRNGHLFQNRYKSILCQQDSYLLELVRYIHLNPLRAKLGSDMKELGQNRYCGHSVLMGKVVAEWQDTEILDIDVAQLWAGGKQPQVVRARSLFCYWATNELGVSQVWLSRKLGLSQPAISLSVARGRQIVSQKNYQIGNL